ncbi:MAG: bifunctional diaminohydroxyphosphoribosylaminopyrimidine deaminase/5-amino-6-(5-phosphoribosylamino)uracil reductase RibD [Nitrospirota bacterium]
MNNSIFMKKALRLAAKGTGRTSPNPMVGAVIVRDGKIIAGDYHRRSGTPHAEILALRKAGKLAKDATLFINLEPCCHTDKKTPPCTNAIIESGLRKVIVAMTDPNPKVSGKGIKTLKSAGIDVEVGLMEPEAKRLNESFAKFITKREPFIILKAAQSLDGKIATASGESKWITGDKARQYVHKLRNEVDAIMAGIGTVIADDPSLDCRIRGGRNPYRIIVDSHLKIPLNAKILKHKDQKTMIATTKVADRKKINSIIKTGHKVLTVKSNAGMVDLNSLMKELGRLEITSVMIEGGSSLNASALSGGIVDKVIFFCAPKIIGGVNSIPSVGGISPASLKKIVKVKDLQGKRVGDDFMFEGYL